MVAQADTPEFPLPHSARRRPFATVLHKSYVQAANAGLLTRLQYASADGDKSDATESFQLPEGVRVGRNDPCPCGSGEKFKNCHGKLS